MEAKVVRSTGVEPAHKQQHSYDSGAYIEWPGEDAVREDVEPKFASNVTGEFVTVVAVEPAEPQPSPYVTVLAIGDNPTTDVPPVEDDAEDVLVYRLPGERLGFALKFEGGLKTVENVGKLYIQSCAPDSPASRTKASWGPLGAGDEVLEIDGQKVCEMTRIDCVRLLKESNVVIKLRIRPLHKDVVAVQIPSNDSSPPPPPIPPRKTPRRNSTAKEKPAIVCPPDGFADLDSSNLEQNGSNKQDDNLPEAEVYMDLLAKEAEIPLGESESDDTGSSISTVVDRLSSNSSFSDVRSITSLDITAPSTPTVTTATTFDLDRVLEPFLQLEREFSSSATSVENSLFTKLVALTESQSHVSVSRKSSASVNDDEALQPPESFKDCPENAVAVNGDENKEDEDCGIVMKPNPRTVHNVNLSVDEESEAPALPPKPTPRKDLKSKFKSGKKRPPPPPPPRSDRPLCPDPESPVKEVFEESDHLPRLIDFVPKDRTDVVVPSAIHPDPNQLDLLIQQRRLIDLINSKPESDASCSEAEVDSWYPCDVLDTIGEVDEEQQLPSLITETVADDDVAEQVAAEQENICLEDSTPQLRTTEEEEQVVDETTGDDKIEDDKGIHAADDIMSRVPETIEKVQTIKAEDPENKQKDTSVEGDNLQAADEVDEEDSRLSKEEQEEEVAEEVAVKQKDEEEEEEEEEGRAEEENTGAPAVASAVALNCEQDNGLPVLPAEQITDIPACLVAANDAQGTNNTGARTAMDTLLSDITALNLSPPPSFSRLPPDGHEFPPDYQEPHYQDTKYQEQLPQTGTDLLPAKTGRLVAEPTLTKTPATPPPLPCTAPPVMRKPVRTSQQQDFSAAEKVLSSVEDGSGKCGTRPPSWRNDEKSEKSVRDKIAMFSNVTDEAPVYPTGTGQTVRSNRTLNRFKSSEDVFLSNGSDNPSNNLPAGKLLSRSVMSVDKVVSSPYLPESSSEDNRLMKKGTLTYNSSVDILPLERRIKTNSQSVLEFANRTCSTTDLTSSSSSTSSAYSSSCSPETSLSPTMSPYVGYSSTLPRKNQTERKASLASTRSPSLDGKSHSTGLSRAVSFTVGSKLHTRSQSLVDVGSGLNKYVPNTLAKSNTEEARRASLNALIEQRRRSISKLRGLVIPEKVNEVPSVRQTILDLPEIISKDAVLPAKKNTEVESRLQSINSYRIGTNSVKPPTSTQTAPNLLSPPWKSETDTGVDLPKYSPAFKRKSLAVYGISSSASSVSSSLSSSREELRPYFDNNSSTNYSKISKPNKGVSRNGFMSNDTEVLQSNEPPKSLESITSPTRSDMSFEFVSSSPSSPDDKMMTNGGSPQNGSIKSGDFMNNHEPEVTPVIKMSNGKRQQLAVDARRSGGEESDNDSAVSSSRSSISHDFSPPPSPLPDHVLLSPSNSASSGDQRTLRRTLSSETTASAASSTASTLTSGSQASCSSSNSDSMNRRVLKAQSVEAINRKNVLSSARFSSGQDLKVGSPLIQRKFENENILDDVEIDNQANNDHQHTKNFIEKLNETLLKEDASETGAEQNEDGEELITYQIAQSNVNFELNPKKVAYLEVEVVDGTNIATESEQILSDSSSSNPSSMDGLSYGYSSDSKIMYNGSENECDNNLNNNVFYSSYEERNGFGTDCEKDDESCRRVKKRTCDLVAKDVKNEKSSDLILSKKRQKDGVSRQKETEVRSTKQKELVNGGKVQPSSSRVTSSRRSVSVNDIRKAFEKADLTVNKTVKSAVNCGTGHSHARVSSLDSTASEDSSCVQTPTHFGSITNLQKEQQFGSITSLASSTSLISQQELQQLIDDANQTLEENGRGSNGGVSNHEVVVVILHRDMPASSVGITLAGGADYESKEITVHKVLAGSPADRDGRIQKGDRILSINGKSMKGVTHRESLTILKAPRPEVVLVVSRWRPDGQLETPQEDPLVVSLRNNQRHPRIPEQPLDVTTALLIEKENVSRGPPVTVCLQKDGAGLGFSLEGGKDSPLGDMPLTIKKIFTGGCAEKSGQLFAGDELLLVNGTDVTTMSRIEAWSLMKRLADGKVTLSLRHKTVTA